MKFYEVAKGNWQDDVDLWPAITRLHLCCTSSQLRVPTPKGSLNYESLDCYQSLVLGWVRQVGTFVKPVLD